MTEACRLHVQLLGIIDLRRTHVAVEAFAAVVEFLLHVPLEAVFLVVLLAGEVNQFGSHAVFAVPPDAVGLLTVGARGPITVAFTLDFLDVGLVDSFFGIQDSHTCFPRKLFVAVI